jgi:DNA-binding PadR family transcriptional regulator
MSEDEQADPFRQLREAFGRKQPPVFFTSSIIMLLLAEEPAHGYALFKKMCDMGIFEEGMDASVVYPTLRALDSEGLIASELVDEGSGPTRKVFHLTREGGKALDRFADHVKHVVAGANAWLRRYEGIGGKGAARAPKGAHAAGSQER